jgi:hypothetical protein
VVHRLVVRQLRVREGCRGRIAVSQHEHAAVVGCKQAHVRACLSMWGVVACGACAAAPAATHQAFFDHARSSCPELAHQVWQPLEVGHLCCVVLCVLCVACVVCVSMCVWLGCLGCCCERDECGVLRCARCCVSALSLFVVVRETSTHEHTTCRGSDATQQTSHAPAPCCPLSAVCPRCRLAATHTAQTPSGSLGDD